MKKLDHENIIKLHESLQSTNNVYLVMDYINGGSLSNYLNEYKLKNGTPFPQKIIQYFLQLKIINLDLKLKKRELRKQEAKFIKHPHFFHYIKTEKKLKFPGEFYLEDYLFLELLGMLKQKMKNLEGIKMLLLHYLI